MIVFGRCMSSQATGNTRECHPWASGSLRDQTGSVLLAVFDGTGKYLPSQLSDSLCFLLKSKTPDLNDLDSSACDYEDALCCSSLLVRVIRD